MILHWRIRTGSDW